MMVGSSGGEDSQRDCGSEYQIHATGPESDYQVRQETNGSNQERDHGAEVLAHGEGTDHLHDPDQAEEDTGEIDHTGFFAPRANLCA